MPPEKRLGHKRVVRPFLLVPRTFCAVPGRDLTLLPQQLAQLGLVNILHCFGAVQGHRSGGAGGMTSSSHTTTSQSSTSIAAGYTQAASSTANSSSSGGGAGGAPGTGGTGGK